jgi:hypothetical protein
MREKEIDKVKKQEFIAKQRGGTVTIVGNNEFKGLTTNKMSYPDKIF